MTNTQDIFNETPENSSNKDYKIINIDIKYKGKMVSLGGLFINDKSSAVAKKVFAALEDGSLTPEELTVAIRGVYNSAAEHEEELLTAEDFA